MNKLAFLFPGQGSQSTGMGLDLYQEYDIVRELFDMAEEITKINLSKLCFKGPMEELTKTVNLQPAVTVVNLACFAAIKKEALIPDYTAGHSLGEYSALCAAGIITKEDIIRLVHTRGMLMHREATKNKGAMCAVIGLDIDTVHEIVDEIKAEGIVSVANHNSKQQIAITGAPEYVKKVSKLAAQRGARAIPLKVSGAWHSELIKGAEDEFNDFLDGIDFCNPQSSLVLNVTADFAKNSDEIKTIMKKQLCSPVRWYDSMCKLKDENVDIFVEVGPGKVLAGLQKKILPKDSIQKIYNVNNMKTLELFLRQVT